MTAIPVLLFPDATQAAIGYLRSALEARSDSAVVGDRQPNVPRWVAIHRVGGGRRQVVIDDSTLVVRCGAPTAEEATDLAQLSRAILDTMPGNVANVILISDSNFSDDEDPVSDRPFSPFSITVSMRGAAA